jgi:hypothetical protein
MVSPNELEINLDILTPVVDLYEFKINNYANKKDINFFTKGFADVDSVIEECGIISTDANIKDHTHYLSSCDVIKTDTNKKQWITDMKELENGFNNCEDLSPVRLIKDIYYEYTNIQSKNSVFLHSDNKNTIWHKFYTKWAHHIDSTLNIINDKYSKLLDKSQIINSYIHIITSNDKEKIIIIGDLHGSMHTFLRIIFRLHKFNILNLKTFKLEPNYRLVFLGDVVDRGIYSFEILCIIFKLIEINNDNFLDPIVIYNRGNHEDKKTNINHDGLCKEIVVRSGQKEKLNILCDINNSNNNEHNDFLNIYSKINATYLNMSSAIILQTKLNNKNYKFYLCHGGFAPESLDQNNNITKKINSASDNQNSIIYLDNLEQQISIQWSDFDDTNYLENNTNINIGLIVNSQRGAAYIYNKYHVYKFMKTNNINFIIRGHQDNYNNNYLFSNNQINEIHTHGQHSVMPGFSLSLSLPLNNNTNYEFMGNKSNIVLFNKNITFDQRTRGPIARILADSVEYKCENEYYYSNSDLENNVVLYPVLTISTNTDNGRSLNADSWALLRFDKTYKDMKIGTEIKFLPLNTKHNIENLQIKKYILKKEISEFKNYTLKN